MNMSSTYLYQYAGFFGAVFTEHCSEDSTYMFAITSAKGEPMVTQSVHKMSYHVQNMTL
jgi:hypothetical protein